jgi:hypothetical protein
MAAGDLITTDWEMEYNGLLIGGDTAFAIAQIDGLLELPDIDTGDVTYASRHGVAAGNDWMRGRTIRLTLEVYGSTPEELSTRMNELTTAFAPAIGETPLAFMIPGIAGGVKVQTEARVRRRSSPINREWYYNIPIVTIELYATSPYLEAGGSEGLTTATLSLPVVSGGVEFDAEFDLGFGTVGTSGTVAVTNSGASDMYPTIDITGPVTNPVVTNLTTGEWWGYTGTVSSGDTLTVDTKARTVLMNGSANRYYLMTAGSEFFSLDPGSSTLRYNADAYTASTATITARSAWV